MKAFSGYRICSYALACLGAPLFCWAAEPDVHVTDEGNRITLTNGLVTAVVDKRKGDVVSVSLPGGHNLVSHGGVTFDAEAFGVGKNEAGMGGSECTIVSPGPDLGEVKLTNPNFINFLSLERHIVMRRGVPGYYEYLVFKHGEGQPGGGVGQLRWVFRGDGNLLTHAFGSATKQGTMIEAPAFEGSQSIADATSRLVPETAAKFYPDPTGHTHDGAPVYTKYDWADYAADHVVHGFSSDTEGIFMVQPSMEYYNGGPTKGVLTVHGGPVSILEFLGGHFLIRDGVGVHLADNEVWSQIIGPWLVYVNRGSSAAELWRDAWQRGQQEKAAWPYSWVQESEDLYPRQRGTLAGTLAIPNAKAANALLVLARPDKDWQTQTMGYEFWTRADAEGHFVLPKVRPGTYALYASVPGAVGEAKITDVKIEPGQKNDLGTIAWQPPQRRELLWRLGTPDRSTAEFRFGSEPRQFGLWWRYLAEKGTKDVDYTIGQSSPAKDWYYAQSVIPMPDGSYFSPSWKIHFDLKEVPAGPVLLTVDLAGAAGGNNHLKISLNGKEIGAINSPNDSGIYRSAVQSANFRHNTLEVAPSALRRGANELTFRIDSHGRWKKEGAEGGLPELPQAGVMYDCIQMEAGPVVGDGSYHINSGTPLTKGAAPSQPPR